MEWSLTRYPSLSLSLPCLSGANTTNLIKYQLQQRVKDLEQNLQTQKQLQQRLREEKGMHEMRVASLERHLESAQHKVSPLSASSSSLLPPLTPITTIITVGARG